jgi:hypothetical protein
MLKTSFLQLLLSLLITTSASAQLQKEYVRLGERVVAVDTVAPANSTPNPDAVSPVAGSGTFTFTYSDPNGANTLNVVNVLINSALDGANACYLAYVVPAGALFLVNDGGPPAGLSAPLLLGSANSVSNSQCTINGTGSSAVANGNSLTLTLNISFQPAFQGRKAIYLAANDTLGGNSGWQAMGVRYVTIPTSSGPQINSLTPGRVSARRQQIVATYSHPSGTAALQNLWILINSSLDGQNACYLVYVMPSTLLLVKDAGPPAGVEVFQDGSMANNQCRIYQSTTSLTTSGNTVTLSLDVEFLLPLSSGNRIIYGTASETSNLASPWQTMGTTGIQ